jgi:orotidine-5'-phosphate decarboxylase
MKYNFRNKWKNAVARKQTLLCVGLDPAEFGQRQKQTLPDNVNKLEWCINIVELVSPYASGIKINRNFIRDFSRKETIDLINVIHNRGMVAIDDAKLSDLGSSNHAGLYHAAIEGFDAVTYSPFPSNIKESAMQAKQLGVGLIGLVLMSNPEYELMKKAIVGDSKLYKYLSQEFEKEDLDGAVIGAISKDNHLSHEELKDVAEVLKDQIILVPGMGEQGGEVDLHLRLFGERTIVNVGRSIIFSPSPSITAAKFNNELSQILSSTTKAVA